VQTLAASEREQSVADELPSTRSNIRRDLCIWFFLAGKRRAEKNSLSDFLGLGEDVGL
jgi:hypothetical protein